MKVFKYQLSAVAPVTELALPRGARILTFDVQNGRLHVWALVDPVRAEKHDVTLRYVEVFPTGGDRKVHWKADYIGTAFLGALVLHAFEVPAQ